MAIYKYHESFLWARNAGADLSEKLNFFAKVDTDGDIVLAGNGENVLGTITEAAAEDRPVTVQFGGIGKVVAGDSITAGQLIASDGDGKAKVAAATNAVVGIALTSADADSVFSFAFVSGRVNA